MTFRRTILLAAGALLAARATAQSASGDANQQPPADQKSWYQKDADKAKELGSEGADATKKGAQSAGKKVNEAGQAANAKVVGTKTVTGKVADVSPDRVSVKAGEGAPMDLRITPSTKVTVDGQKAAVSSIKQGDPVRASYAHSGGESTATKIDVKRSATPAEQGGSSTGKTGSKPKGSESQ